MRAAKPQTWLTRKEATSTSQKRESKSSFTASRRSRGSVQILTERCLTLYRKKRRREASSRSKVERRFADAAARCRIFDSEPRHSLLACRRCPSGQQQDVGERRAPMLGIAIVTLDAHRHATALRR
jgi:hypothetical protein